MLARLKVRYVSEFTQALAACAHECEFYAFCRGAQAGNLQDAPNRAWLIVTATSSTPVAENSPPAVNPGRIDEDLRAFYNTLPAWQSLLYSNLSTFTPRAGFRRAVFSSPGHYNGQSSRAHLELHLDGSFGGALSEASATDHPGSRLLTQLALPGEPINRNQVRYGDAHLRRLKLVRALLEVGGLSIASIGRLLAAVDSPATTVHEALGKAQYTTTPTYEYKAGAAAREAAAAQVAELISHRGWRVRPESPARDLMVSALAALRELDQEHLLALADAYAAPAEQIAATNIATTLRRSTIDDRLEGVVIGSVLGDTLFAAMRRLAEKSASTSVTPQAEPSP